MTWKALLTWSLHTLLLLGPKMVGAGLGTSKSDWAAPTNLNSEVSEPANLAPLAVPVNWQRQPAESATSPLPNPPIPSPPDRDARLAQLYSYRAGSCNASGTTPGQTAVPTVSGPDAQCAFGVIARGEAPYLEEWVLYHLFIGVDIIYLYDNEDVPTYHRLFECNPRVKVIHFPNGEMRLVTRLTTA